MRALLLFVLSWIPALAAPDPVRIVVNSSQTLKIQRIASASVANGKIAKVRPVPPETLLVTGVSVGETMLRAWDEAGKEYAFGIRVVPAYLRSGATSETATPVVKVSIEFLELNSRTSKNLGIHWPEKISFSGSAALSGYSGISGMNYSSVFSTAEGWIDFLVSEGWARLLASPELYVRMGEEGVFHSGGEFPVSSSMENYGRQYRRIEWKPYGLTVKVRPQSADSFNISSDIQVEVSEINPAQAVENIPSLTRRRIDTKMDSEDGETVILSGLLRDSSVEKSEGLPGFSRIPLLGPLFASFSERRDQTELLMAMTLSLRTKTRNTEELKTRRLRIGGKEKNAFD